MRSRNFKGRCTKKKLLKSQMVARLYDSIQIAYAEILDTDPNIKEIMVNHYLQDCSYGEYTSDFVCIRTDGSYFVRECVYRGKLLLPRTCKLLDISREYWFKRGVSDWGIVIEENGDE